MASRATGSSIPRLSVAVATLLATLVVTTSLEAQPVLQFANVTTDVGIDHFYSPGFFSHYQYAGGGAVGDFNNDGWMDIFALTGGDLGVPDQLYINNGDGTFTDQAAAWGLTEVHRGKGCATGDFNNDGWLDIYVTSAGADDSAGHHKLYRNNAGTGFTDVAAAAGVNYTTFDEDGFGSTFGDYDLDGDLDLFVCGFKSNNDGNVLFRNNGDGTFTEVTAAAGLFVGDPIDHKGFSPRFFDTDGDHYPELLMVADFGTSIYFKNNGDGTFTDWSVQSGTTLEENGMGQGIGDFDGDAVIDWYVCSIYRPSIGWTGNKLYLNNGHHEFTEISASAGVYDGGYGWGAVGVDFNQDTLCDIAETNGALTPEFEDEQSYLWLNNGDLTFDEVSISIGFTHYGQGRGLVNVDYDNDGDEDLVVFATYGPLALFENQLSGTDTHWLRVLIDTQQDPSIAPNGIGSLVYVTANGLTQVRVIDSGDSFLSKSELAAHFGLGAATTIDELRVVWVDGTETTMTGVAVDQVVTVQRTPADLFVRGDVNADGGVNIGDPIAILGELFQSTLVDCERAADVNSDDSLDIADVIYALSYIFTMGAAPGPPFPDCGAGASVFDCAISACP